MKVLFFICLIIALIFLLSRPFSIRNKSVQVNKEKELRKIKDLKEKSKYICDVLDSCTISTQEKLGSLLKEAERKLSEEEKLILSSLKAQLDNANLLIQKSLINFYQKHLTQEEWKNIQLVLEELNTIKEEKEKQEEEIRKLTNQITQIEVSPKK